MNRRCISSVHIRRAATCFGLVLALSATAPSQEKPRPNLVLEAGTHDLAGLIDRSARYMKRNYLYSAEELTKTSFTLQEGVALNTKTCEEFVSQIAYGKGFAMTPVNRSLKVYEFISLRGQNRERIFADATVMTVQEVKENSRRYIAATTSVTFKHLDATRASQQLRPFFAASGRSSVPLTFVSLSSQSMVISGFAPHIARALQLLEMADVPQRAQPARSGAK